MSGLISASFTQAKFKQQQTKCSKQLSAEEEEEEPEYAAWFRVWFAQPGNIKVAIMQR